MGHRSSRSGLLEAPSISPNVVPQHGECTSQDIAALKVGTRVICTKSYSGHQGVVKSIAADGNKATITFHTFASGGDWIYGREEFEYYGLLVVDEDMPNVPCDCRLGTDEVCSFIEEKVRRHFDRGGDSGHPFVAFAAAALSSIRSFPVAASCPMHACLVQILEQDNAALPRDLLDPTFWKSISCDGNVLPSECSNSELVFPDGQLNLAKKSLQLVGYSTLQGLAWDEVGVSISSLAFTIDSLKARGFPAVFIFMYDQAWLLWEHLFDAAACILDANSVQLDLLVFAWSLCSGAKQASVGSNFGRPHRDSRYAECHTTDGRPSSVSVWLPLVPVTTYNGCMYVVPANRDPLFDNSSHDLHMKPEKQMVWEYIRALPADAGDLLVWRSNLIHWGSACDENVDQPRKSVAASFTLPGASADLSISKAQLQAGLGMATRLRLVVRALLSYEHWHPRFSGLDEGFFQST